MIDVTTGIPEDTIKYGVAFHECIDADGNSYKVVKIGDQTWIGQNLDVSHFSNGDPIPQVSNDEEWEKAGMEKKPAWHENT